MTLNLSVSKLDGLRNSSAALGVASLIIAGEYFFRHYVLFWLPTFGTLLVNDMVALFMFYSLLTASIGMLLHTNLQNELAGVMRALRVGITSWSFTIWLMVLILSVAAMTAVDRELWGNLDLTLYVSSYRNPNVLWTDYAPTLRTLSLLSVNGLFVPVAEEFLWRGVVQVRLISVVSAPLAIGLTATLFSLKHALVDASMDRFLALVAFGLVCGIVARRSTWRRSAALHVVVNTIITIVGLILGSS